MNSVFTGKMTYSVVPASAIKAASIKMTIPGSLLGCDHHMTHIFSSTYTYILAEQVLKFKKNDLYV